MRTRAVIEIAEEFDPRVQAELVASAYRLSRNGLVVLALRGISRKAVDRLLDPVVATVGRDVVGILYVEAPDPIQLLPYVAPATQVVGVSEGFHSAFRRHGIPVLAPAEVFPNALLAAADHALRAVELTAA